MALLGLGRSFFLGSDWGNAKGLPAYPCKLCPPSSTCDCQGTARKWWGGVSWWNHGFSSLVREETSFSEAAGVQSAANTVAQSVPDPPHPPQLWGPGTDDSISPYFYFLIDNMGTFFWYTHKWGSWGLKRLPRSRLLPDPQ